MKKAVWIIGVLIFVVVAGFITVNITKQVFNQIYQQVFEKETANLSKEQKENLTAESIFKHFAGKNATIADKQKVSWAGHLFEIGYLDTLQYQTTGNKAIKFTDSGWYAPSYSLPRSKLLDVNLNQKVKVKIVADFGGEMKSTNVDCTGYCITTEKYHFSEFGIYMIDESGNRQGMRVLGTRHNIEQGNNKNKYNFSGLTVENTGDEVTVTDSTGYKLSYSSDFNYVTGEAGRELNRGGDYGKVNPDQKWMLGINCHVNGEGYCKLDIKEIEITK